jgi:hypothetical protein
MPIAVRCNAELGDTGLGTRFLLAADHRWLSFEVFGAHTTLNIEGIFGVKEDVLSPFAIGGFV